MPEQLTIVLVTQPGREDFFRQAVKSISRALHIFEEIKLFIFLNGSTSASKVVAENIQSNFPNRTIIRESQFNSVLTDQLWHHLKDLQVTWVHFPGDDDIVVADKYKHFFSVIKQEPDIVAVPFNALVIDVDGKPTGKRLRAHEFNGSVEDSSLAAAFHKPPFVWPSLIFDFNSIEGPLFLSRYVFDWWLSLQLVCKNGIRTINEDLILYRTHKSQESQMTSEFRKRFEARMMMEFFVESQIFFDRIHSVSSASAFAQLLDQNLPIYGDVSFGAPVLLSILEKLHSTLGLQHQVTSTTWAEYFAASKIWIKSSELPRAEWISFTDSNSLNFQLEFASSVCGEARSSISPLFAATGPVIGQLGCSHSLMNGKGSVVIDCESILDKSESQLMDSLLVLINDFQVQNSVSTNSLASWEAKLLRRIRVFLNTLRKVRGSFSPFWMFRG